MFALKYLFLNAHINEHPKKNEPYLCKQVNKQMI
jgi:hypothetical protein